jgi:hypothetical protein
VDVVAVAELCTFWRSASGMAAISSPMVLSLVAALARLLPMTATLAAETSAPT